MSYAPITKDHVADGMTLAEICSASLRWSDNTAANLILQEIGGVENFKVALKNIGDKTTKPARNEPELNLFNPKDNRDTSTPRQMVKNLQVYIKPYPLSRTFLREREKQQFLPEPLLLSFY